MGKLTSFISGAGQGYLAGQRYKDAKDRNKTQDDLLKAVLLGKDGKDAGYSESFAFDSVTGETTDMKTGKKLVHPGDIDNQPLQMANGGMVQPMPTHHDKMSWQRQSFKK